ncbi:MAG: ATP-dependent helicase [Firmicutes bacterium]|nr:ATP-dependent helicase [Bacillota bacterium]
MHLDSDQSQAVYAPCGHILVIAPAGSGKTKVLTERVRRLIKGGAAPSSILCVTFTRKAAGELKERLGDIPGIGQAWIGTFHSICYRILREESSALGSLGYRNGFSIIDAAGAEAIMQEVLKGLSVEVRPEEALHAISLCCLTLKDDSHDEFLHKAASLYRRRLLGLNAMDFDDLLVNTLWLLQSNDEVRLRYAQRFHHMLIDEFQDLDPCQWEIVKFLTSVHGNLFAVGDPQQEIFGFKGGAVDIILEYMQDPGTRTYILRRNYRSTANIVAAANSLIKRGTTTVPIPQVPVRDWGDPIDLYVAPNDSDEAIYVAELIKDLLLKGIAPGEIAVLTRTRAQFTPICKELIRARVPYRFSESVRPAKAVKLMTIHASRGKEFSHVILPGLEEGIIPHFRAANEGDIEEERRLAYVAITRARDKLYLSYSMERALEGRSRCVEPSRFLKEIDERLLDIVNFREASAS